jgi:DNA replication and repair protein RecF
VVSGLETLAPKDGAHHAAGLAVLRLALSDFRCYAALRVECGAQPVVLTGPNGAGKTNLLEALSLLAPGRGLRRARSADLDRRAGGESAGPWAVAATLLTATGPLAIGTGREPGAERRVVRIDGAKHGSQKELAERLSLVWLTPEMDRLFVEAPKARRRFLDRLVFGFDPGHAEAVGAYEHYLRERARVLADGRSDDRWCAALEDGMARHGVAIAATRAAAVARLDCACADGDAHFPRATLALEGEVDAWLARMPALDAEERMRARLAETRALDAESGRASCGPHRSDLLVAERRRRVAAAQGSTGEQKALLLSLLLAYAREIARERGEPPILLFDEVAAHLDRVRRAALFAALAALGCQAWLTGTDEETFAPLSGRARFFRVLDATVTER